MTTTAVLYDSGEHRNVVLDETPAGSLAVQANQHLIIHGKEAMLLDPGGHKVYSKVMADVMSQLGGKAKLRYIFLSHQDPDIVAAVNGWLMTTDAEAYCSALWLRFIPHFGVDRFVADRLIGLPDEGGILELGGVPIQILPAHFLHACGNLQAYDPVSKILYTGDLAASVGAPYTDVTDWDTHLQYTEGFHRRYMTSRRVMALWATMARQLDVETIAPQHGAMLRGKDLVNRFIDWAEGLECGIDLLDDMYKLPNG